MAIYLRPIYSTGRLRCHISKASHECFDSLFKWIFFPVILWKQCTPQIESHSLPWYVGDTTFHRRTFRNKTKTKIKKKTQQNSYTTRFLVIWVNWHLPNWPFAINILGESVHYIQRVKNMVCGVKSLTCQRCLALLSVIRAVNKAAHHLWHLSHWSDCRPVIKTPVNLPTQGASGGEFLLRSIHSCRHEPPFTLCVPPFRG